MKKGEVDYALFIPSLLLFGGSVAIFLFILPFMVQQGVYDIKSKAPYAAEQETFLAILRTPIEEGIVADLIIKAKISSEDIELRKIMNEVVNYAYPKGDKKCWKVFVDGELTSKEDCKSLLGEPMLDSEIILPKHFGEGNVNIRITVPGYAE